MKKIVYLTWGETPRSYGVFGSQVIRQFKENALLSPDDQFHFISAVPLIHSGLIREKLKYSKELQHVKEELGDISFSWIPIYASQNIVYPTQFTFKFMHLGAQWHLKNLFNKIKPDILHCRSYHAAWAALSVKKKYNLDYKIIFDGRGLWPEEIALKKGYHENGKEFLFLKSIEQQLLKECDISVAVSDTMKNHYIQLNAQRTECIYLSSSVKQLTPIKISKKNNERITFCYVGALSENTWHKPQELARLYSHLQTIFIDVKLIIVTTANHDELKPYFHKCKNADITFTSTKTLLELKNILNQVDIGIMSYFIPHSKREMLLSKMVLAVKTVEYLAAGLPILSNKYCGGASYLIQEHKVGISYNPNTFSELTKDSINTLLTTNTISRCVTLAENQFDYCVNAEKYNKIYSTLA
jgi:glycosyltransferase involved in cell wall biosynthesis